MTRFQKLVALGMLAITALMSVTIGLVFAGAKTDESVNSDTPIAGGTPLPVATFMLGEFAPPLQMDAYRGVVVSSKEADLGFRRGGRIESVTVEEGRQVSQGEVLARLDSSDVRSRWSAAKSQIAEAEALLAELVAGPRAQTIDAARSEVTRLEASLALARLTSDRQRTLMQSSAASIQQFDEARFAVQQGEAALESAKQRLSELVEGTRKEQVTAQQARVAVLNGQLATLEVDLADTQIFAPFAGTIAKRYVDEGTITSPQLGVLRLIQCDPLEARFGVAVNDARELKIGGQVTVSVDQQTMQATVARIEPELDLASRTQGVFVTLPGGCNGQVVPGQTISLAIQQTADDALWVPIGSLSRAARGLWSVYVVSPLSPRVPGDSEGQGFRFEGSSFKSGTDKEPLNTEPEALADPHLSAAESIALISASASGSKNLQISMNQVRGEEAGKIQIGKIERREVQLVETDTNFARIVGTMVKRGDRLVSGGIHRITPGMLVTFIEEP